MGSGPFFSAWRQFLELDDAPAAVRRTAGGMRSGAAVSAEVDQQVEEIRRIYADAQSYSQDFPALEESYRTAITRFREQLDKDREATGSSDPETMRRRTASTAARVTDLLEQQHKRTTVIQSTYEQRLESLMKRGTDLEQACAKIQAAPDSPTEQTQACSKLADAFSMLKAKSEIVAGGFTRVEGVYQETRQASDKIAAESTATPASK